MTQWAYRVALICNDKDVGNVLAGLSASYPGPNAESDTFSDDRTLSPSGWWAVIPAKARFADVANALAEDAPYSDNRLSYLRDRGVTSQQWDIAKATFPHIQVGLAGQYEYEDFVSFAGANGYTVVEGGNP